ncbi:MULTISPECIES: 8-oxo-dGTP diphosphatase MutT [Prochlorococcus]|nr:MULTISPECIES: 8-oxo-dGTP diphosphatase MutT [Prochlorococcus]
MNQIEDMRSSLLNWFKLNGRHWIPWKVKSDGNVPKIQEKLPVYPIWVAEVMLQQTQLKVVLPYWEKWMRTFPILPDFAHALDHEVLLLWQGLGYYSRAHRMHQASKKLLDIIGHADSLDPDSWPSDIDSWIALPGIGRNTAASIISSAFNVPASLLDGNVKRILARLIGSKKILSKDSARLWKLSDLLLDNHEPRNFNQALMDLGSTVCTIKSPKCCCCPWKKYCLAYHQGNPTEFPIKGPKKLLPDFVIGIGLIFNDLGEILIAQRKSNQSMGGMWEFPGGKQEEGESIEYTIIRELQEELGIKVRVGNILLEFDHSYTHKKLHFVVYFCELISGVPKPLASLQLKWVKSHELVNYPFPAANKKMISALKKYLLLSKDSEAL